jgi:hypothetical protein
MILFFRAVCQVRYHSRNLSYSMRYAGEQKDGSKERYSVLLRDGSLRKRTEPYPFANSWDLIHNNFITI